MTDAGYQDLAVELYDHLSPVEDRGDVDRYRKLASRADGPALELACGTGRVYLELLAAGLDVDGFDASEAALDELRRRADERALEPSIRQADMTDFATDREYGFAYCPFNSLQHATTVDDQLGVLESVHDALAPGGAFAFDVFVPSFDLICETYGEWEGDTVEYRGEERTVRQRTRIVDAVEQRFRVETEVLADVDVGVDGAENASTRESTDAGADANADAARDDVDVLASEAFEPTMLPSQQVELLARSSSFESWSVEAGFDGGDLEHGEYVQVWTLEKAAE